MSDPFTSSADDALRKAVAPVDVPKETTDEIANRITSRLKPVRPMPSRAVLVAVFLAIFAVVTAVLISFVGARGAEVMTLSQFAGILAAVVVSAGLAAASLSVDMTPGQRRYVRPGVMIGGVLLALAVLIAGLFPWEGGPQHSWHCFRSGFLFSLPAVALVILLVRRGAVLAWGSVGACAGLLGGLVGLAVIHVGCPMLTAPHIAAGHLTIPLVSAFGGWAAGRAVPSLLGRRAPA